MIRTLLANIFKIAVITREKLYQKGIFTVYKSTLPIVCVGNISVGGSGKTPTVIYLVNEFKKSGWQPVVLSRGYGGSANGPLLIQPDTSPKVVGDEPLLIYQNTKCPVIISKNRSAGARFIEKHKLGNLIIMDDGLQHHALSRQVNILCLDVSSEQSINNLLANRLMPVSRLRETLANALPRVNLALLINRSGDTINTSKLIDKLGQLPTYHANYSIQQAINNSGESLPQGSKVFAFCGLADPQPFISAIKNAHYQIEDSLSFKDHHDFTKLDLEDLKLRAGGKSLLCTEKDIVKIKDPKIFYLPIKLNTNSDFSNKILEIINSYESLDTK